MIKNETKGLSITLRMLLMQVIIIIIVAVIIGLISYQLMVTRFGTIQKNELRASITATTSLIENDIGRLKNIVEHIANSDAVEKYYKSFNAEVLVQEFHEYRDKFPEIVYANENGEEEVKTRRGQTVSDLEEINNSVIYSETRRTPNQVILSRPEYSASLKQPVFRMAYRHLDYFDKFRGYINVAISLSRFEQVVQHSQFANGSYVVIVNDQGDILYAPDQMQLSKSILSTDTDIILKSALSSRQPVFGDFQLLGTRSVVMSSVIQDASWNIFVAIPTEIYYGPVNKLKRTMIIVVLAALLIGLFVSFLFARNLSRPVRLLTKVTGEISKRGTLSERVKWHSKDELGLLAHSFNHMLDKLENSQSDLVDARNEVENIITSMADSLVVVHPDGSIIKVNEAVKQQLGYSEKELLGMPIDSLIAEEEALFKAMLSTDMAKQGIINNIETTLITKSREKIPVVFSGSVLHNSEGRKRAIVFVAKDITERKRAEEHLNYLANHDSLTGLPNRMLFLDRLTQVISRLPWKDRHLGVLFLDLDRFKNINDTLGHDTGDLLLKRVAEKLINCVREGDTVARLGGDEFVIMLNDIHKKSDVVQIAKKIIQSLSSPIELSGEEFVATTSIGISIYPADGEDPHVLLKNADTAMYRAKDAGRNNFKLYAPDMNEKATEILKLESALRRGIDRDELVLHYQPQVSLKTGEITGVEALVRWMHPDDGLLSPDMFLPIAEDTGLIVPLGEQVLYKACRQAYQWLQEGYEISMAVNIAERQFKHINLPALVSKVLVETGLPAEYLDLELTEGILIDKVDKAVEILERLKEMGITLSLDDFGTGYSSLSYLKRFSLDTLKVDKSFVMDIPEDEDDMAITRAVVEMGRSMGMDVIAEGVENEEQLTFLQKIGCQYIQGYYFSKPLPAAELAVLLKEGKAIDTAGNNFKLIQFGK